MTSTVAFTPLANDPRLGETLEIRLIGIGSATAQVDIGDVRLNVIPEPGALRSVAFGVYGYS